MTAYPCLLPHLYWTSSYWRKSFKRTM